MIVYKDRCFCDKSDECWNMDCKDNMQNEYLKPTYKEWVEKDWGFCYSNNIDCEIYKEISASQKDK